MKDILVLGTVPEWRARQLGYVEITEADDGSETVETRWGTVEWAYWLFLEAARLNKTQPGRKLTKVFYEDGTTALWGERLDVWRFRRGKGSDVG